MSGLISSIRNWLPRSAPLSDDTTDRIGRALALLVSVAGAYIGYFHANYVGVLWSLLAFAAGWLYRDMS